MNPADARGAPADGVTIRPASAADLGDIVCLYRAIGFDRSLGFGQEGTMRRRIRNPDGSLEPDIPMAWPRATDGKP